MTGYVQTLVESAQVSVVHERPSVHEVFVAHTAPDVHAPQPAVLPSLQAVPVRGVHPVVLLAVLHHRQPLPASTVPFA